MSDEQNFISEDGVLHGKWIVCLKERANMGKTGTIFALVEKLLLSNKVLRWNVPNNPPSLGNLPPTLNVEIQVKGRHIGFDTEGDFFNHLKKYLDILVQNGCELIFCTCRSKGGTPGVVKNIAKKSGYSLVFTAPYIIQTNHTKVDRDIINRKKAEHLKTFI